MPSSIDTDPYPELLEVLSVIVQFPRDVERCHSQKLANFNNRWS